MYSAVSGDRRLNISSARVSHTLYNSYHAAYSNAPPDPLAGFERNSEEEKGKSREGVGGWAGGRNHPRHKIYRYGLTAGVSILPGKCRANRDSRTNRGFTQYRKRRPAATWQLCCDLLQHFPVLFKYITCERGSNEGKEGKKEMRKKEAKRREHPKKIFVTASRLV